MAQLGMGIVGTGMIAGVVAEAITQSKSTGWLPSPAASSTAPSSSPPNSLAPPRSRESKPCWPRRVLRRSIFATPTTAKEKIALAAIAAGKHVLVDKPFMNEPSVLHMSQAAQAKGLVFLDATHFVHHPRTAALQKAIAEKIGSPRSLHTAFYFPSPIAATSVSTPSKNRPACWVTWPGIRCGRSSNISAPPAA